MMTSFELSTATREDLASEIAAAGGYTEDWRTAEVSDLRVRAATHLIELHLPMLHDLRSGEAIRPATAAEWVASATAADIDGGSGAINVDGETCYVIA